MLLLAAIAVSVMTHDAWLVAAHAVSVFSAVGAAIGVLLILAAGLRRVAARTGDTRGLVGGVEPYELGQTGLTEKGGSGARRRNQAQDKP